jgi:membrane complex biogenesis BtpA family protein
MDRAIRDALAEASILVRAGFHAVLVENMHDRPYLMPPHPPQTTAAMTRIVAAIRDAFPKLTLGVQVLACGEHEALAIALAAGASFIRCENFVFAHVGDEGFMPTAAAGPLLRFRRSIGAEHIAILADIKKKHASHAITADLALQDVAHGAEFFGADGLIITGAATGMPTDPDDVAAAREASRLPIYVGSGVTPGDARALFNAGAAGLIVGSSIKKAGRWVNPVDPARARALVAACRAR